MVPSVSSSQRPLTRTACCKKYNRAACGGLLLLGFGGSHFKIRGTILGVPIIRILSLYRGPPILGNYCLGLKYAFSGPSASASWELEHCR